MIKLDLGETLFYNIGINAFFCVITLIIFHRYRQIFADTYDIRLLRLIQVAILLVLLTDIGTWVLNGKAGNLVRTLSYVDNILYFFMQILVAIGWLKYAHYRIFGQKISRLHSLLFVHIPFAVLSTIIVTAPLNGWFFYLDGSNQYHRGALFASMSVFIHAYLLSVSVIALVRYKRESSYDRKKELLTLAFFSVPPFIGGVVQTVLYGASILWPCAVISSLLVLLDKESLVISQDSLTRLNNRRNMERHLAAFEEGPNRAITLILLDINHFKSINDVYGHSTGDLALIQTADILRAMFNRTSAFLARYGGDEFVITLPQGDESVATQTVREIKDGFAAFNRTNKFPFQLFVCAGHAVSAEKTDGRIANMFKEADSNLYRDKMRRHQETEVQP